MIIELCQCEERAPHQHIPERWTVLLDNGAEIKLDRWHVMANLDRIDALLAVHAPTVNFFATDC